MPFVSSKPLVTIDLDNRKGTAVIVSLLARFRMSNSGQQPPASAFRALLAGAAISAAVSVAAAGVSAARRRCVTATSKCRSRQPSCHNFPASVFCRMFSMLSQHNTDWIGHMPGVQIGATTDFERGLGDVV